MSVQQGRSPLNARSVLALREHGKMARTPLTAFFNILLIESVRSHQTLPQSNLLQMIRFQHFTNRASVH